jgi:hypothetical protein
VTVSGLTNATGADALVTAYVTAPYTTITQLSGSDYWESLSCPANNCGLPANKYAAGGAGSFKIYVQAGSAQDILMVTQGHLISGSLMAQADPTVEIDPAFLAGVSDPSDYSLGFSENIVPTPVPPPRRRMAAAERAGRTWTDKAEELRPVLERLTMTGPSTGRLVGW